jgi:hypothetical protein
MTTTATPFLVLRNAVQRRREDSDCQLFPLGGSLSVVVAAAWRGCSCSRSWCGCSSTVTLAGDSDPFKLAMSWPGIPPPLSMTALRTKALPAPALLSLVPHADGARVPS